jgi:hypothetical protein
VPFVKKKSGELQRKVGKLGQTSKIIIIIIIFCSVCSRDGNNSIEKMFLENLEKNLEKRIPA